MAPGSCRNEECFTTVASTTRDAQRSNTLIELEECDFGCLTACLLLVETGLNWIELDHDK